MQPHGRARNHGAGGRDEFNRPFAEIRSGKAPARPAEAAAPATTPSGEPVTLRDLERDARKLRGDPREILLSFMSDPYHSDEAAQLTREPTSTSAVRGTP